MQQVSPDRTAAKRPRHQRNRSIARRWCECAFAAFSPSVILYAFFEHIFCDDAFIERVRAKRCFPRACCFAQLLPRPRRKECFREATFVTSYLHRVLMTQTLLARLCRAPERGDMFFAHDDICDAQCHFADYMFTAQPRWREDCAARYARETLQRQCR